LWNSIIHCLQPQALQPAKQTTTIPVKREGNRMGRNTLLADTQLPVTIEIKTVAKRSVRFWRVLRALTCMDAAQGVPPPPTLL
jgi:hypothetical protein